MQGCWILDDFLLKAPLLSQESPDRRVQQKSAIMKKDYRILPATRDHVSALPGIERAAASIFPKEVLSIDLGDQTTLLEDFEAARLRGHLWVAVNQDDQPVGFAMVADHGSILHLEEVDVEPKFQQQGIGTGLVGVVCQYAREACYQGISLTTFSTIPWNAPWYQRLGFRVLGEGELSEELKAILQDEANRGLDPKIRVAMYKEI